ncbi:MAG: hypothetical protein ABIA02_01215 [Candidatus Falkowbacteria bacterium]
MDALKFVKNLNGTKEKARKITTLEAQQLVCQVGTPCDCRGCPNSG